MYETLIHNSILHKKKRKKEKEKEKEKSFLSVSLEWNATPRHL